MVEKRHACGSDGHYCSPPFSVSVDAAEAATGRGASSAAGASSLAVEASSPGASSASAALPLARTASIQARDGVLGGPLRAARRVGRLAVRSATCARLSALARGIARSARPKIQKPRPPRWRPTLRWPRNPRHLLPRPRERPSRQLGGHGAPRTSPSAPRRP